MFPQFMQFGAMSSRGCRVAMQLHLLFSFSAVVFEEERLGFVWISRLLMAESRSESVVEAPCIAVPPVILTLVFGAGEAFFEVCDDAALRGDRASDIKAPAAEGGGFEAIGCVVKLASSVNSGS